ncbi:hypothetical protein PHLCEN_2v9382 [Hermanssonia centrifuga]|uniref:N-acetyltransferase domain-containing protein n=1 Tax=Hermanssonia centrifuga TaxID=98765 RepID=A0A2R6NQT9_9APHY|nr:hypothetical protein PHLCEN_2v9382 [Hermanssonia centrifuga]
MFEIVHLVTISAKRGRGYASALVRMVTDMADQQGRATWLASSNVAVNTDFYNSLGFVTVKQFMLGDDNPMWKEAPFPIAVVKVFLLSD